jgi:hypothetical protein
MKIDESSFAGRSDVTVRCPHCGGVGRVCKLGSAEGRPPLSNEKKFSEEPVAVETGDGIAKNLFSTDSIDSVCRYKSGNTKLLALALASFVVAGIFALLVNLVLPGPGGSSASGFRSVAPTEQDAGSH